MEPPLPEAYTTPSGGLLSFAFLVPAGLVLMGTVPRWGREHDRQLRAGTFGMWFNWSL